MDSRFFILIIMGILIIGCESQLQSFDDEEQNDGNLPTFNASFSITPLVGTIETLFQFDASSSTDENGDNATLQFRWKFSADDNFTVWSDTMVRSKQFSTCGSRAITLEIKNLDDETASMTKNLQIFLQEVESNNNQFEAQHLTCGQILGEIGYNNDKEDWYKFGVNSNAIFSCSIANLHSSDISNGRIKNLKVLDSELNPLISIGYGGGGEIMPNEEKVSEQISISAGEMYYIKIIPQDNHAAPYKLKLYIQ